MPIAQPREFGGTTPTDFSALDAFGSRSRPIVTEEYKIIPLPSPLPLCLLKSWTGGIGRMQWWRQWCGVLAVVVVVVAAHAM